MKRTFKISDLLKPHSKALGVGLIAVAGEGIANLLEPWPLKIVFDAVLKSGPTRDGWLYAFILSTVGDDRLAILKFCAAMVMVIAVVGAIGSYTEKYVT